MERLTMKPDDQSLVTLCQYGCDLTQLAREGKLDPMIGRKQEMDRVTQILLKRRKNNPCLVGDPGVGKTVIVEGLAQSIANGSVPPKLSGCKVFSLEMGRLIAGASNRGEFEQRLINLISEVKRSEGKIILFIDELHTLIGAGGGGNALDAANIMKPALARGELTCIGATTCDEYRKYVEKDGALQRRFQAVDVPEPSVDEAVEILRGLRTKYEDAHGLVYDDSAFVAAVMLSKKYMSQFLPDKAIDVMDEAGSLLQMQISRGSDREPVVTESDIQSAISNMTRIPVEDVSGEESEKLLKLEETLCRSVIGQEKAVESVCRAIRRSRAGLGDPDRPIASLLFTGPTGVGKTELAKAVAQEFFGSRESIVRFDMSEYSSRHEVSKLFGSPPGYVGHDRGGMLTEAVRRRPHSLILLDEIDKAHNNVFDAFLQVLDDGRMTDSSGRTVDFSNTLVILTSNIGSCAEAAAGELSRRFRPEFLNRIDEVAVFERLSEAHVGRILEIMLEEVGGRLRRRKNMELRVSREAKAALVKEGYHPSYGARALRRAVKRQVEDALADAILEGAINGGQEVFVGLDKDGQIRIDSRASNLSN